MLIEAPKADRDVANLPGLFSVSFIPANDYGVVETLKVNHAINSRSFRCTVFYKNTRCSSTRIYNSELWLRFASADQLQLKHSPTIQKYFRTHNVHCPAMTGNPTQDNTLQNFDDVSRTATAQNTRRRSRMSAHGRTREQ